MYTKEKVSAKVLNNSYFNTGESKVSGLYMITTPTCTKCKAILGREDDLTSLLSGRTIHIYEFNGEDEGIEVLSDMGMSSAPIFLSIKDDFSKKTFKGGSDFNSFVEFVDSIDSIYAN